MSIEVHDLAADHLDGAAVLLAERYQRARRSEPAFSAGCEEVERTRAWLQQDLAQAGTEGVVAVERGRVVGFLLGVVEMPAPRSARSLMESPRAGRIVSHAAAVEDAGETYRRLYAAFAPRWLQQGVFEHNVGIEAGDAPALAAWYSLGFGQRSAHAMRSTTHPAVPAAGLSVRRAVPGDEDVMYSLTRSLFRHLAASPAFEPYLAEAEPAIRSIAEASLGEPDTVIWLGERTGAAVGAMVFRRSMPRRVAPERALWISDAFVSPEERGRGAGLALLGSSLAWARAEGYDWCLLNFMTANLTAARFWTRTAGFRPISYFLCRRIDERIAWAHA